MKYICLERELINGSFARLCEWADFLGIEIEFDFVDEYTCWVVARRK